MLQQRRNFQLYLELSAYMSGNFGVIQFQ